MNIKKCIGARIKELRKGKNISQEQLAEQIDISQNALSQIETGDNFFTAETLEKLIIALNVEPEDLFNFKPYQSRDDLMAEIVKMLENQPEKIQDVYKITRALTL